MRYYLAALAFVGTSLASPADGQNTNSLPANSIGGTSPTATVEPFTLMTWNLEWFFDNELGDNYSDLAKEKTAPSRSQWDWKRDAVAEAISASRPSVLALQEVENRRVLWYLTRALARNHKQEYHELGIESRDHFTEQDVGFLFRPPVDALTVMQGMYPKRMRSTNQYFDLSKHIRGVFEFRSGETVETITVLNIHFRARPEAADKRLRQARLLHYWIAAAIRRGQNVIATGDFNTEFKGDRVTADTDIGIACGLETPDPKDDLVDLHEQLPSADRATHLMGGQYDRILCSRSLIEDDPNEPDLVFRKIEVLRQLAVRGETDAPDQHWNQYWNIPDDQRDLSDHYPVMATFEIR